jgi:tetratricopeptide (TPR) repeat protein
MTHSSSPDTDPSSLMQVLDKMGDKPDFSLLKDFVDTNRWFEEAPDVQERLGALCIKACERLLKKGDESYHEVLLLIDKVAKGNTKLLLAKARLCIAQPFHAYCWRVAVDTLNQIVKEDSSQVEAWIALGMVHVRLGNFYEDPQYFEKASGCLEEGEGALAGMSEASHLEGILYWQWGLAWYYQGKNSGEAVDFCRAVEKFQIASEQNMGNATFWNEYGSAIVEFASLTGKKECYFDAVEMYSKSLHINPKSFNASLNLASAYQYLYGVVKDESLFKLADEAFEKVLQIDPADMAAWLKWGILYTTSVRHTNDVKRVKESLDKFENANACEAGNSLVLARWGEALVLLGAMTDQLDLIKEGESKIVDSLTLSQEGEEIWSLYGMSQMELGFYFNDDNYFHNAIEKFQMGIELNPKSANLHFGLAQAFSTLGDSLGFVELIERSLEELAFCENLGFGQDNPNFRLEWGITLTRYGDLKSSQEAFEEAIEQLELGIELQGGLNDVTAVDPEFLYHYGCALDFLGDFTGQVEHHERSALILSQLLMLDPDYFPARFNLALSLVHIADLTTEVENYYKAFEQFKLILSKDPEDGMAWNEWGVSLVSLAQLTEDPSVETESLYKQAEEYLKQSIALGYSPAYYHLACLYCLGNDLGVAMHFLGRAKEDGALPPLEQIMHDDWLENIREKDEFKEFIAGAVDES